MKVEMGHKYLFWGIVVCVGLALVLHIYYDDSPVPPLHKTPAAPFEAPKVQTSTETGAPPENSTSLPESFPIAETAWLQSLSTELRADLKVEAWLERPGLVAATLTWKGKRLLPSSLKWREIEPGTWALASSSISALPAQGLPEFPSRNAQQNEAFIHQELHRLDCGDEARVTFMESYWKAENLKLWTPVHVYQVEALCGERPKSLRERWTLRASDLSLLNRRPLSRE